MRKNTLGLMLGLSALSFLAFFMPMNTFAQTTTSTPPLYPDSTGVTGQQYTGSYCTNVTNTFTNLADLFKYFTCLLERSVLPLLFTIAGLVFVWGAVKFISSRDSSEKEAGQQFMLWGVIAFAVMLSVWGLVNILRVTFHINNVLPVVPVPAQIK